ncbi:DUF2141 domain-containing protein [Stakelama marina]|uniref:DUF2141 domain-containing protein n=1 Tax=Stakelama marina TaxID=2826939 RepID=A0A8T4ID33_9SPHN|nr:DUF2141 domain-containing protein [Stakelama marina]MBR0552480.1 DUF2141 domain-containing protein [Stakelama marina]
MTVTKFIFAALGCALVAAPAAAQAGGTIGSDAAACNSNDGPAIRVNVTGLKDRTGRLKLELYPATKDDFLKDDHDLEREGKTFRRVWADMPASGPVALCIKAPHPGTYALFFTHDRDGKNKFNFWKDGAGVPSNDKLGRSKPDVDEAEISVGTGITVANIRAQYLRGLSGFGPLKN